MAQIRKMEFDGVIVGGGGSGLRAALQLAQSGLKTAVISKVFLPAHIRFRPRAVLPVRSPVTTPTTIGAGICTTPSKGRLYRRSRRN